jgi:O-antigen/teichoic acid export membrane protein
VDPNRWPEIVWLLIALMMGVLVVIMLLLLWRAIFRRRRWVLDTLLLGCSGFILVAALVAFLLKYGKHIPPEWSRAIGPSLVATVAVLLVWISRKIRNRMAPKRVLGSAKGEFTVPKDFNDPLPKEIEDEFCER